MRTLHIPVKSTVPIILTEDIISRLPNKIALVMPVQHIHKRDEVIAQLHRAGKEVVLPQGYHTRHDGQVLGCDQAEGHGIDADAYLCVADGAFHPKALATADIPVFVYDLSRNELHQMDPGLKQKILGRRKGALARFYTAKTVGVLVTTKPGQRRLEQVHKLRQMFPKKAFYCFGADTMNLKECVNFPFVEVWVNTACPRMEDDHQQLDRPLINARDIAEVLMF